MQEIWVIGLGWDDPLPDEIDLRAKAWFDELKDLSRIKIPRSLQKRGTVKSRCLHTFVDVSENAYGAVVYLRIEYEDDTLSVYQVAAKTKVAPLKAVSIPRLELIGAQMGSTLAQSVGAVLLIGERQRIFWSDSVDVLWWIRGYGRMYKPFISNRVGYIQSLSGPELWRYVPTEVNPADHLTRGLRVSEQCWWTGPEYLLFPEVDWPVNKVSKPVIKEVRKKYSRTEESFVATNLDELTEDKNFVW